MFDGPLHPALVHIPLGLAFVVPLFAVGVWIAFRRGLLPRSAFAIVAALQLVLAASGFAAMAAGDRDEKRVKPVVGRQLVHDHEERGEAFVWTAVAVAGLGIALLLVPARALTAAAALTAVGSVAVAGLGVLAGKAGGEIVYRHGGAAAYTEPAPAAAFPAREERGRDRGRDHD